MSDRFEILKEKFLSLSKESEAFARLAEAGVPFRHEDWKYTKLNSLVDFLIKSEKQISNTEIAEHTFSFEENLMLVDGKIRENTVKSGKISVVKNVSEVQDFVSDLNLGYNSEQIQLDLNDNSLISISFITSSSISAPRIRINSTAESTLVISVRGVLPEYFSNYLLDINLEEKSKLKIIIVQEDSSESFSFSTINSEIKGNSKLEIYSFNIGGKLIRNNINVLFSGEKSDAKLFGLNVLNSSQHVDNHTILDHAVPHCESIEIYKGVYGEKSRGVFDGTIIVRKDAQKTNAIQKNQSLLLSRDAVSNAKPQLKIWADDVKCTHGATVGQLDENAIFYLQARGIPKEQARAMLIKAFCSDIYESVEIEEVKLYLQDIITRKLSN